jgi:hypothetical protein
MSNCRSLPQQSEALLLLLWVEELVVPLLLLVMLELLEVAPRDGF